MKHLVTTILIIGLLTGVAVAQSSYATSKGSGTIMISGSGTYETDLSADFRSSFWALNTDAALFLFPQFAVGIDFGYMKSFEEVEPEIEGDEVVEEEEVSMTLGPRAYVFLGNKHSELTPFLKFGGNYGIDKFIFDGEEDEDLRDETELGLVASAGVLLNLAKNVGLSIEAEYSFEKGTDVEEIDTKQLFVKFGIRSFLGE